MTAPNGDVFSCTLGGAVATGRRRLARLLVLLATALVVAAIFAWSTGRLFAGFLALFVACVVGLAWRMSGDLVPRRLRLSDQTLHIETPSRLIPFSIEAAEIRQLDNQEIGHLEVLTAAGGFVAGSGGFDSRHLGEFDLYASDFANAVFIQSLEGRLVVTPDRPADFIRAFEKQALPPATIPNP